LIEPIATAKVDELIKVDNDKRYKVSKIESLRICIEKRYDQIKSLQQHIIGFRKDSNGWKRVRDQIMSKEVENTRDIEILERLQIEETTMESPYTVLDCDEKLAVAAEDIKEMKTDSCKFSKTIFELM